MKSSTRKYFPTYLFSGVLITVLVLSISACTRKTSFLTSAVVPAARGNVTVNTDKNENYVIQIQLSGLAEVERLDPPKQTYVVWMVTDRDITKNLGQINSSSALLSSKLKAVFETVSPMKPVRIFITAENDPAIEYPGNQVVLSTDKF